MPSLAQMNVQSVTWMYAPKYCTVHLVGLYVTAIFLHSPGNVVTTQILYCTVHMILRNKIKLTHLSSNSSTLVSASDFTFLNSDSRRNSLANVSSKYLYALHHIQAQLIKCIKNPTYNVQGTLNMEVSQVGLPCCT